MTTIDLYTKEQLNNTFYKKEIIDFLFTHLEQYGDSEQDIEKAVNYVAEENGKPGGLILTARSEHGNLVGACVINKTGMEGYIPENILVYIATDKSLRGKGIGKKILEKAIDSTDGDIALHCEPENPARFLYEKMGFQSKYIEMRLKK